MTTTTRTLADLKEGDEVALLHHSIGGSHYQRTTIVKVTPTGIIKLANGKTFNPDGYERGNRYGGSTLLVLTDAIRAEMADRVARGAAERAIYGWFEGRKFRDYSTADLRRVAGLIAEIEAAAMAAKGEDR